MIWKARQFQFEFPRPALVMGVVNVTPDSFSDGGHFLDPSAAIKHALRLVEEGADILDIGGESTRPNAAPVSADEELRRVLPVIEGLSRRITVPISIDTQKPAVARAALAAGASVINDIAANRTDRQMGRVVAEQGAGYVAMHMQGTPQTMQAAPAYEDVVAEVGAFFSDRLERLATLGVAAEQIALDVGIGFGKTKEHNLALLRVLAEFRRFARPLLLGVSRKSLIAQVAGGAADRLGGSLAAAVWAVQQGAAIVRAHDVGATRQALRMIEAINGCAQT
jgi:dihydropteroate synthase